MDWATLIRAIPDFPVQGILFRDITTLLSNAVAYREVIDELVAHYQGRDIDLVAAIEARGFILGAPLAYRLGTGFVPVRKPGKLPAETTTVEYALEYGTNCLEMHIDAIQPGQRVLIVDDLLATGGSAKATAELVERLGGVVAGLAFLIELAALRGVDRLAGYDVFSLVHYQ